MLLSRYTILFLIWLAVPGLAWDPNACRNAYGGMQCLPDRAPPHLHAKANARLRLLPRLERLEARARETAPAFVPSVELPPIFEREPAENRQWVHRDPYSVRERLRAAVGDQPGIAATVRAGRHNEQSRARVRQQYLEAVEAAERADASPEPIGPETRDEMHREIIERAVQHYVTEGVQLNVQYQREQDACYVFITPEGDHPMNRRVKEIRDVNPRARVMLLDSGGRMGGAQFIREKDIIMLGARAAIGADPDVIVYRHERRHLYNAARSDRDLGYSRARKGARLPKGLRGEYEDIQGHDEMDAYAYTLRDEFDQLRYHVKKGNWNDAADWLTAATHTASVGRDVSGRSLRIAEQALKHFAAGEAIKYQLDESGRVEAVLTLRGQGGQYDAYIPLPGGSLENPANNRAILETRLKLMRDLSRNHVAQFEGLQRAIDRIAECKTENSARAVVEGLRGTIRIWTANNYEPITREDTVERFNRIVDRHWARLGYGGDKPLKLQVH